MLKLTGRDEQGVMTFSAWRTARWHMAMCFNGIGIMNNQAKGEKEMGNESGLRYVVVLNDGGDEPKARASFDDIRDAMEYADTKAALHESCDPGEVTGCIARYEVIDAREVVDGWETKYETPSFYND